MLTVKIQLTAQSVTLQRFIPLKMLVLLVRANFKAALNAHSNQIALSVNLMLTMCKVEPAIIAHKVWLAAQIVIVLTNAPTV